jgi:hypothetical protein
MDAKKSRKSKFVLLLGLGLSFAGLDNIASAAVYEGTMPKFAVASNSFVFNPRTLKWKAMSDGKVIRSGQASGGKGYCPDTRRSCRTPSGHFHIISKGGADCVSSKYPLGKGGAKMPYCMFFSKYYAIHGSYELPGYNASHGCIRIEPSAARWLNHNFMEIGTPVIVKPY